MNLGFQNRSIHTFGTLCILMMTGCKTNEDQNEWRQEERKTTYEMNGGVQGHKRQWKSWEKQQATVLVVGDSSSWMSPEVVRLDGISHRTNWKNRVTKKETGQGYWEFFFLWQKTGIEEVMSFGTEAGCKPWTGNWRIGGKVRWIWSEDTRSWSNPRFCVVLENHRSKSNKLWISILYVIILAK